MASSSLAAENKTRRERTCQLAILSSSWSKFLMDDCVGRDLIEFMSSWFDITTEDPCGPVLISVSIPPTTPKDYSEFFPLSTQDQINQIMARE